MSQYCENPSEPLRLQKAEDLRIAPHLHTSAELLYIERGSAVMTIGALEYSLYAGDFALIMPSMLHCITPGSESTSVYVINCKGDVIPDIMKRYTGLRPASPVLRSRDVPKSLLYALSAISAERDRYVAFAWASLMFTVVTSGLRFAEIHDGVTSELSNRVLSYLGLHYREQISLDNLADVMGVSRFHLSHLFSNKLGIGFKEYLNNLRVEYAKGLLRSTSAPISEICTESGFENQRTFNRVFRDNTGASPRDYRLHREDFGIPTPKHPEPEVDIARDELPEISAEAIQNGYVENDIPIEEAAPTEEKKKRAPRSSGKKKRGSEPSDTVSSGVTTTDTEKSPESVSSAPKKKKKDSAWFF